MAAIEIRTLTSSLEEAQAIASHLVGQGICASADIDQIESYYTWQGQIEHCTEYRLMLLTRKELFKKISQLIAQMHSYQEPGIYCFEIQGAPASYLAWIQENSNWPD